MINLKLNHISTEDAQVYTAQDREHGPHYVTCVKNQLSAIKIGHLTRWTFELLQHGRTYRAKTTT